MSNLMVDSGGEMPIEVHASLLDIDRAKNYSRIVGTLSTVVSPTIAEQSTTRSPLLADDHVQGAPYRSTLTRARPAQRPTITHKVRTITTKPTIVRGNPTRT